MNTNLNAIKRFNYTGILGWSVSRYDKFVLCKRQYYYDYYAKHDTEYGSARINALKQMTTVPLETGNIVHDIVRVLLERLLSSDRPVDRSRFRDYIRNRIEDCCKTKTFAEVYYKEMPTVRADNLFPGVNLCLNNLLDSERFAWITREALSHKNGWVIEPPGFGETRINGLKAYCKVDFLFPVGGTVYILDWKTGRRDEKKHAKQLLGYSAWAAYHFERRIDEITPIAAYLNPSYDEMVVKITEADVSQFAGRVAEETREMYSYCLSPEQNTPKPKSEFPLADSGFACRYCNYRELCSRASKPDVPSAELF